MSGHLAFLPIIVAQLKGLEPAAAFAYQVRMEEPSPRSSRLALAGALAVLIVFGGAGFLLGRGTAEPEVVVAAPEPAPEPQPAPEPVVRTALGRAGVIALAAAAADATASGQPLSPDIAEAHGRRFELRLPFGCAGPAGEGSNAPMRWTYDAESGVLRVHVTPTSWSAQDWAAGEAGGAIEGIEGFWIQRPWTTSEACPPAGERAVPLGAEPVTLPGQTLAIGQVFFAGGPRGGRRSGAPYEATVRVAEDRLNASQGFRLRLAGRITRAQGLGPVRCRQPAGPEQRPICLVSVVMDEVAIENPATNETLAIWTLDGRNQGG